MSSACLYKRQKEIDMEYQPTASTFFALIFGNHLTKYEEFSMAVQSVGAFPQMDKKETFFIKKSTLVWPEIFFRLLTFSLDLKM